MAKGTLIAVGRYRLGCQGGCLGSGHEVLFLVTIFGAIPREVGHHPGPPV